MHKVLVVDDDKALAESIKVYLDCQGFDTLITHSGSEAEKLALSENPAVIVLDIMLPEVDGYTLVKRFEKHESLNAAFILISGKSQISPLFDSVNFHTFLTKPFELGLLHSHLIKALNK